MHDNIVSSTLLYPSMQHISELAANTSHTCKLHQPISSHTDTLLTLHHLDLYP